MKSDKSVLILDTPDCCLDCRFHSDFSWACLITNNVIDDNVWHEKPDNCPLKPLPEAPCWLQCTDFEDGWIACLEKILGGSE